MRNGPPPIWRGPPTTEPPTSPPPPPRKGGCRCESKVEAVERDDQLPWWALFLLFS